MCGNGSDEGILGAHEECRLERYVLHSPFPLVEVVVVLELPLVRIVECLYKVLLLE
jgi:hypothetical protein